MTVLAVARLFLCGLRDGARHSTVISVWLARRCSPHHGYFCVACATALAIARLFPCGLCDGTRHSTVISVWLVWWCSPHHGYFHMACLAVHQQQQQNTRLQSTHAPPHKQTMRLQNTHAPPFIPCFLPPPPRRVCSRSGQGPSRCISYPPH